MTRTTDIVLSASAIAAAIGALSDVVQTPTINGGQNRILVTQHTTLAPQHQDALAAALSHTATQYTLRQSMGVLLPAMDVDKETLEETWMRVASTSNVINGGGAQGVNRVVGPHTDSTLGEALNQSGMQTCYTNCHSACHGSRGWR